MVKTVCSSLVLLVGVAASSGLLSAQQPQAAQQPAQQPARELNWAEKMFSELEHDFAVVARGADVRHRIAVTNLYEETVQIQNVGTSCGCTAAQPSARTIATGEVAYIEIAMDTQRFMHLKESGVDVTLTFNGQNPTTVHIPVRVYIRSDVVLTPGRVDFGSVEIGAGGERRIGIAYAGRDDWAIREVRSGNDNLTTELVETARGNGRINYDLIVRLSPDAPQGVVQDQLVLVTNDEGNPYVPLMASGSVVPDIVVNPEVVDLGVMNPGVSKTQSVLIRGRQPFAIERIEADSDRQAFAMQLQRETRSVHIVPLTVTPPNEPGEFSEDFTVTIAGREAPVTFRATGRIVAPGG